MAKMAELHAQLSELPYEVCEYCSDPIEVCDDLEECPGKFRRQADVR
jgi:hypothetical protein